MLSARRILPELILQADEDVFNPIRYQIYNRKWENFTKPIQAIGHLMVKEFYANAWEPDKAKRNHPTYTSSVRGTEVSFAPSNIKRVLKLKSDPYPNAPSYHERKANKDYRLDHILEDMCEEDAQWVCHRDGRPHYLRRSDLEPISKGWYEFICRSILPTTNHSELTVERAMLIHSIVIDENINVEEIIAEQIYKFVYKTDISSSLPFPKPPIVAEAVARTREPRVRARQATPPQQPPQQHPQQPPQFQQQQDFSSSFYTHFDTSMSQLQRRLDQQHEENRRSFEAINTRMDRMDDQLSFLCYSNQLANEQMLSPYQNTARQFKEMEMQGIPVTMANLAIHSQRGDTFVSSESEEF
ncbi:hypothetical protein PIB30_103978 [Stylosanthes scabra]|uniref:Putative plant transposon protein domain-containing protein n=1 Tax=Stylosanthes scabra TaxID=79078 RepID=A0ABU6VXX7_9FABA|nr:hypothetical protein [Stylosanthes scabra]